MASVVVSPTSTNPTHHVKLSDGSTSLGFILRSGNRIDPRGIKDAGSDRSRYADAKRAITRHGGTVMVGPQENYTTGYRQQEMYMPGKLTWVSLLTSNRYIAYKVTASATGNRHNVSMWIRRRGTPTSTLTVELCSDTAGNPGSVLKTVTATTSNITDTVSQLYRFLFPSVQAVTNTTVYHIKIYTSTADSATDYWEVGTDAADTNNLTKASSDGSSWNAAAYDLYFRMVDDTNSLGALFFNYKGQVYFITRPAGADAPKLYINGDRGVATGAQTTTTLKDTSKAWTVNEFAGAVVLIYSGTNSEWTAPYRTVISNTSDTLTFAEFPKAPVAASTVYVILGSNKWTEVTGHGLTVLPTSVISLGDICYFAQGDTTKMRRMREYLNNVTWTREFAEENNYAKFLIDFRHPTKGLQMGKVNDYDNTGRPSFAQASAESWGRRLKFPMLINDCEATTGWTAGAGAAVATDNAAFMTQTKSIKLTVSSGPANPAAYFVPAAALDIRGHKAIRFWFKSNFNRAAGDIKIFPSVSATAASTIQDLSLPALVGEEWQQITLPFIDTAVGLGAVASIGIRVTAATGTYHIDGIETIPSGSEVQLGNPGEKITGVERYGDPEVPWVFRTRSAGSVEEGIFSPIPLRELSTAESVNNGVGHTVHNVYLFFSFLGGLERFYRNNLDDVGPNRDEGLPTGRRGFITSMAGYVGRFFENYDVVDGYSSIMESASGTDHHEVYRSDTAGRRIRNLFLQVVPGDTTDRLWFTESGDVVWLPLPGNTLKEDTDEAFRHTHEAVLETGWMDGSEKDAVKIFSSVKLFLENVTSSRKIEWDYKKNDDATWTPIATPFTTPPVQEIALNISAKRIKLRFRLQTNDNTETPIIRAMFVSATTRPETRYTYTMSTLLEDSGIDIMGNEDTTARAATILATLDGWMEANTILTMNSVFSPFDSKSVFLEPIVTQPFNIIFDESKEKLQVTLVLIEP